MCSTDSEKARTYLGHSEDSRGRRDVGGTKRLTGRSGSLGHICHFFSPFQINDKASNKETKENHHTHRKSRKKNFSSMSLSTSSLLFLLAIVSFVHCEEENGRSFNPNHFEVDRRFGRPARLPLNPRRNLPRRPHRNFDDLSPAAQTLYDLRGFHIPLGNAEETQRFLQQNNHRLNNAPPRPSSFIGNNGQQHHHGGIIAAQNSNFNNRHQPIQPQHQQQQPLVFPSFFQSHDSRTPDRNNVQIFPHNYNNVFGHGQHHQQTLNFPRQPQPPTNFRPSQVDLGTTTETTLFKPSLIGQNLAQSTTSRPTPFLKPAQENEDEPFVYVYEDVDYGDEEPNVLVNRPLTTTLKTTTRGTSKPPTTPKIRLHPTQVVPQTTNVLDDDLFYHNEEFLRFPPSPSPPAPTQQQQIAKGPKVEINPSSERRPPPDQSNAIQPAVGPDVYNRNQQPPIILRGTPEQIYVDDRRQPQDEFPQQFYLEKNPRQKGNRDEEVYYDISPYYSSERDQFRNTRIRTENNDPNTISVNNNNIFSQPEYFAELDPNSNSISSPAPSTTRATTPAPIVIVTTYNPSTSTAPTSTTPGETEYKSKLPPFPGTRGRITPFTRSTSTTRTPETTTTTTTPRRRLRIRRPTTSPTTTTSTTTTTTTTSKPRTERPRVILLPETTQEYYDDYDIQELPRQTPPRQRIAPPKGKQKIVYYTDEDEIIEDYLEELKPKLKPKVNRDPTPLPDPSRFPPLSPTINSIGGSTTFRGRGKPKKVSTTTSTTTTRTTTPFVIKTSKDKKTGKPLYGGKMLSKEGGLYAGHDIPLYVPYGAPVPLLPVNTVLDRIPGLYDHNGQYQIEVTRRPAVTVTTSSSGPRQTHRIRFQGTTSPPPISSTTAPEVEEEDESELVRIPRPHIRPVQTTGNVRIRKKPTPQPDRDNFDEKKKQLIIFTTRPPDLHSTTGFGSDVELTGPERPSKPNIIIRRRPTRPPRPIRPKPKFSNEEPAEEVVEKTRGKTKQIIVPRKTRPRVRATPTPSTTEAPTTEHIVESVSIVTQSSVKISRKPTELPGRFSSRYREEEFGPTAPFSPTAPSFASSAAALVSPAPSAGPSIKPFKSRTVFKVPKKIQIHSTTGNPIKKAKKQLIHDEDEPASKRSARPQAEDDLPPTILLSPKDVIVNRKPSRRIPPGSASDRLKALAERRKKLFGRNNGGVVAPSLRKKPIGKKIKSSDDEYLNGEQTANLPQSGNSSTVGGSNGKREISNSGKENQVVDKNGSVDVSSEEVSSHETAQVLGLQKLKINFKTNRQKDEELTREEDDSTMQDEEDEKNEGLKKSSSVEPSTESSRHVKRIVPMATEEPILPLETYFPILSQHHLQN